MFALLWSSFNHIFAFSGWIEVYFLFIFVFCEEKNFEFFNKKICIIQSNHHFHLSNLIFYESEIHFNIVQKIFHTDLMYASDKIEIDF